MKKNQNMPFKLQKMVLQQHKFMQFVEAGKGKQSYAPTKKECNKYDLTTDPYSKWTIIIIGPPGLLLVVSCTFAITILVLWVGYTKINS
jgi:hypothetical protein